MKDYLLIFRGGINFSTAKQEEIESVMLKWEKWMEGLAREGKNGAGHRLSKDGAVITNEKRNVTDRPFAEGKEIVGGYKIIRAQDFNEALEISKNCPILDNNGTVEIREMIVFGK